MGAWVVPWAWSEPFTLSPHVVQLNLKTVPGRSVRLPLEPMDTKLGMMYVESPGSTGSVVLASIPPLNWTALVPLFIPELPPSENVVAEVSARVIGNAALLVNVLPVTVAPDRFEPVTPVMLAVNVEPATVSVDGAETSRESLMAAQVPRQLLDRLLTNVEEATLRLLAPLAEMPVFAFNANVELLTVTAPELLAESPVPLYWTETRSRTADEVAPCNRMPPQSLGPAG